ncbi:MAG: hypothetical protein WC314_11810 [Vulcanimicrobiota bacterium]
MNDYLCVSPSVQELLRMGLALSTLGMLALSLPAARRFFGSEKYGGYADDGRFLNILFSPPGRVLFLSVWIASACWLLADRHTVLASLVCLLCSRFCFVSLRWKSISRGMGAPGFMLYWLAALVFFLEYTRYHDPSGYLRMLAIFTFKIDFAVIVLCAGQYKLFSGYPQNNGMELGMVNPWWGKPRSFYRRLTPQHWLFRFLNHCAYLGELVFGALLLFPPTSEIGGLLLAATFVFIFFHLKLGSLCPTVIVCCFLFCQPGGLVDGLLPSSATPAATDLTLLNLVLGALLATYLVLLPFMKLGTYYNFYGKKRLPEKWQAFQDRWTNLWGIAIWRVFTIDNTNFYVDISVQDRATGRRVLYSTLSSARFRHVGEFVCLASIFTTLRYFPGDTELFTRRLLRYARTIPHQPGRQTLIFQWIDIRKDRETFHDVPCREFEVDLQTPTIRTTLLEGGASPTTDPLRYTALVKGQTVGSYAP